MLQGNPNFSNLAILVLEVYQNNRKSLFLGVYKPPNQNDIEFLNRIGAILDYYSQKYDNVTIIGDFNITTENTSSKYDPSIQSKQFDQRTNMFSFK